VVFEVQVGIVDPEGAAGLRRWIGQLLAEAGYQAIAALDVVQEVLVAGSGALEDHDRAHVHVARGALVREERDVRRAQAVEMLRRHHDCPSRAWVHVPLAMSFCWRPSRRRPASRPRAARAAVRCRRARWDLRLPPLSLNTSAPSRTSHTTSR